VNIIYSEKDEKDLDLIGDLWVKLIRFHTELSPYFTEEYSNKSFFDRKKELLEKSENGILKIFIAEDKRIIIGYCICTIKAGAGEIDSIFVEKEYRKHNIGDEFLIKAEELFENNSVNKQILSVYAGNEAVIKFYNRHNYYQKYIVLEKKGVNNMKTALLIIDVQNDYFPKGKMELNNSMNASIKIKDLLNRFRNMSLPVIHIRHISIRPGVSYFLPDTAGSEIHMNVKPIEGEEIIIKNYPNSFRNTKLDEYLKDNNISKLVIAGMMTHMCVDSTVRAAFDLGYQCITAGDCCATRNLNIFDKIIPADSVQLSFLAALNGVYSRVLTKDEVTGLLSR
jgi:nicotinamidase-related amidase/GNAT superfamily N-acetyltransferase